MLIAEIRAEARVERIHISKFHVLACFLQPICAEVLAEQGGRRYLDTWMITLKDHLMILQKGGLVEARVVEAADRRGETSTNRGERQQLASREQR